MKFNRAFNVIREEANGGEGAAGNSGGASGGGEGGNGEGANGGGSTVSVAEFNKLRTDAEKHKADALKYKQQIDDAKTAKLKETNDWKAIAEAREAELAAERETTTRLQDSYLGERKYTAIQAACQKLGLRPEAVSDLESLDLGDIQVETTNTGKLTVLGAERFAETLKRSKPHWFADKGAPSVNTNGTRVLDTNGAVTTDMLVAAEKEGRKTGDLSKYHSLFKTFQSQRAASTRR